MRYREAAFLTALLSVASPLASTSETASPPAGTVPSYPALEVKEEPGNQGTRIRVSTAEVTIVSSGDRALRFHLECLHPIGDKQTPHQCVVYLVSSSPGWRYKEQETPFSASVNGAVVFERPFKSYTVAQDDGAVIEPLISFWSWDKVTALAQARQLTFTLAGERITVPDEAVARIRQLVAYFGAKRSGR